jgi:predicted Zn-dependent protease/predicted kinase
MSEASGGAALIAVAGGVARAKSTISRALATRLGAERLEADRIRSTLLAPLGEEPSGAESRWRRDLSAGFEADIYADLLRRAEDLLASGCSVVLDACFPLRAQRRAARALAARHRARFLFVECRVGEETLRARLAERDRKASHPGWTAIEQRLAASRCSIDELSGHEKLVVAADGPLEPSLDAIEAQLATISGSADRAPTALDPLPRIVSFDCWSTLIAEHDWPWAHSLRVRALRDAAREAGRNVTEEVASAAFDTAWHRHVEQWEQGRRLILGFAARGLPRMRMSYGALRIRRSTCGVLALLLVALSVVSCASGRSVDRRSAAFEAALVPHCLGDDQPLAEFVSSVGRSLLEAQGVSRESMRFRVIRMEEANAFALSNGGIFITLPLLLMLNSDEELAMVLGHEIGHVRERHVIERMNRERWLRAVTAIPLLPLNVLTGNVYGDAILTATFSGFSRDEEREADDLASESLRLAGSDLRCGIEFYRSVARREAIRRAADPDARAPSGIWATHPDPQERFERIAATFDAPADPNVEAADWSCKSELLDRIDGFTPTPGVSSSVVVADDGTIFLLRLGLQITPGESHRATYRNGWLDLAAGTQNTTLHRVDPGKAIESIARETLEAHSETEAILFDDSLDHGRPSVRAAWLSEPRATVEFRHWLEITGRVYRLSSEVPHGSWNIVDLRLRDLAAHIEPLDVERIPVEIMPLRFELHRVVEGDTLESLAEAHLGSSLEELAVWNGLEPGQPLRPGSRLKIVVRFLPPID